MSEQPRIIGRSQLHSSIELLQKHRSKVAATSTLLLLTTVFLVPIYLVFNQRQHSLHLTSLFSSHEVYHSCCTGNTWQLLQHLHLHLSCPMRLLMHFSAPVVHDSRCFPMQCVHDDGRAETRICRFDNLILHRSQLLYIYSGASTHSAEAHDHDICYIRQWPVQTYPAFKALHLTEAASLRQSLHNALHAHAAVTS